MLEAADDHLQAQCWGSRDVLHTNIAWTCTSYFGLTDLAGHSLQQGKCTYIARGDMYNTGPPFTALTQQHTVGAAVVTPSKAL
jgi:hypothetical protein